MSDTAVAVAGLTTTMSNVGSVEKGVWAGVGDEHVDVGVREGDGSRHIERFEDCIKLKILYFKFQFS